MSFLKTDSKGVYFIPVRTLILLAVVIAGWLLFGDAPELLIYDRSLIGQGEVWRLVTAHFVHVDFEHLIINLLALMVLGALLEYLNVELFMPSLILGLISVTTGLWFGMQTLLYYCGLSGVLNSLFTVIIWQLWSVSKDPMVLLLGVLNIVKILVEMKLGSAVFSSIAWPAIAESHLLGVLGGFSVWGLVAVVDKKSLGRTIAIMKN